MKSLVCVVLMSVSLLSGNIASLQYKGVSAHHTSENGVKNHFTLEREIDPDCLAVPIDNDTIWKADYASRDVPKACKATFVTSLGQIQPMQIHKEIETLGELEVLDFIEKMQKSTDMLLVDSRTESWYLYRTIPGAINISHDSISDPDTFPDDYKNALRLLGVKMHDKKYDFSHAKTIAVFCNGAWCGQSPHMIKSLLQIGYPAKKIKWYRGGLQDWLALSLTTIRDKDLSKRGK